MGFPISVTPLSDSQRARTHKLARDARDLLIANLDVVDRVVAFTCRRQKLDDSEAEEFGATVKLKLVENDYAIIRKFEGRSSFSTFLAIVVQRLLLDYRIHMWGRWHPSAEAKRLGDSAVELEKILFRDGRTIDEAARVLGETRETVEALASRLPARPPKRRLVDLDQAASVATPPVEPSFQRRDTSQQISKIVRQFVDQLPPDERLILQLRFDSEMTVAQIARSLALDQKQLYRRIDKLLHALREELQEHGVDIEEAKDLIGDRGVVLDFRLGNSGARPSTGNEETITKGSDEVVR